MNKAVTDIIETHENNATIVDTMLGLVLTRKLGLYMVGFADDLDVLTDILEEINEQSFDI